MLYPFLAHAKERTLCREVLTYVAAWVRACDGVSITPRGNCSSRSMHARAHDSLAQLRFETVEIVRLCGMLIASGEIDERRRAE